MDPAPSRPRASRSATSGMADAVADVLRQQLIHGKLRAGERLSEAALSQQLETSRNTLREAFRILMKEGLLQHVPNCGVSVVVPSIADIIDIYRVRRLIECQALEKAWPLHPAHKLMRDAVLEGEAASKTGDWLQVGSANMAFHAGIVALHDSKRLSMLYEHLAAELRLAFGLLDNAEYLHSPYVEYNARLLELFMEGQMTAAARELDTYLLQSERMVLAVYSQP